MAKRFRFRVLRGSHAEGGKVYKQGSIVDSKSDLRKHNRHNSQKFLFISEVDEDTPPAEEQEAEEQEKGRTDSDDTLESMTLSELRAHAAAEEIDTHSARTKAELIAAIRAAL